MEIILLISMVVGFILYLVISKMYQKKYLKTLTQDQFIEGYRKSQLIDVREANEYENGHILGARNIPLTQIKARKAEIRTDKPVYLYCQSGARSARAAATLKKMGCKDISHLQGGFKKWTGKVKRKGS